ncbi:SAM-dependent methyltransferase [Streptomyces sp. NPDC090303]|uniref:SAM-dependent methyltransferase n=1 Tax=Streptomyces sp. NPDC090303 TaxID=3365960 RepID=UPI0037F7717A
MNDNGDSRRTDTNDSTPSTARMYDYFLGGTNNLAVDRAAATRVSALVPNTRDLVWENRYFVQRAVRTLARAGIRQFLDIGAGLPTQGNVHEIALLEAPGSRTVYVDHDPTVLRHSSVAELPEASARMVAGDVRDPGAVLADASLRELIDLSRPTAVILAAVLHFVTDDEEPGRLVAAFRDGMSPGSHLVLSHLTSDGPAPTSVAHTEEIYRRASSPLTFRGKATIQAYFDGLTLLPPGLVRPCRWNPDPDTPAGPGWLYAGVARKA